MLSDIAEGIPNPVRAQTTWAIDRISFSFSGPSLGVDRRVALERRESQNSVVQDIYPISRYKSVLRSCYQYDLLLRMHFCRCASPPL